ncbi:MAG: response regulator [Candidatus Nealsonbacteria bacterium CG10_big_fil_rev_8_21_14_0_10_36_23]|uniref:Response regulator n=1 Tax=Candidatus Nealsonbacteria bacterium CG10_big_fil_rev_8_21_14_0_10_36_23 TaxID=1974709 RepID=A0A2H0TLW6_9BACT|nr:MAG: response regulator [Candidatus Nealsonbacteria bacterium CG10_big_fil_rev_8_21_14_0_10_36_23]
MAKTILVVEDDKFLRELIVRKLIQEDFSTSEAIDGEDGMKKIKEEKPDLVLLDLILPGIDGFEVLSKMKEDMSLTRTPVIILSNLGQKDDVERGFKLGAVDYLIKAHFTPGEIIEKVKGALK